MAREKDWIDYVNLGSNLVQNLQLNDLQNKVGGIFDTVDDLAAIAASEENRKTREDNLREIVFQAETVLRKLRTFQEKDGAGVLALSTVCLGHFTRNSVSSGDFRSFEDKERVHSVIEGFKGLSEQCRASISEPDRHDAESCAQYMLEMKSLDRLILSAKRKAERDQTAQELKALEHTMASSPKRFYPWEVLALCMGAVSLPVAVSQAVGPPSDRILDLAPDVFGWTGLALIALGGLPLLFSAIFQRKKLKEAELAASKQKEVSVKLDQLSREVENSPDGGLTEPDRTTLDPLLKLAEQGRVIELERTRAERKTLIAQVLKENKPEETVS